MKRTVLLNVVGLTPELIGDYTPNIKSYADFNSIRSIKTIIPAVTCSVQSTFLTGKLPSDHGIVGNGWYFYDLAQVSLWKQSNALVQQEKIWDKLRKKDPNFTVANIFWWFNMYSTVDYAITPRPIYLADGRKIPDFVAEPSNLKSQIKKELGEFPLFNFWGPNTSIISSEWIANAAMWIEKKKSPTLSLVYLPHLDYGLQKYGTDNVELIKKDLLEVDRLVGQLIDFYQEKNIQIVILSEYGITSVSNPVHINRILRENGFLAIKEELGLEHLDLGNSKAFAVADHQIAHIYIKDKKNINAIKKIIEKVDGIKEIWGENEKKKNGLHHERAGDIVLVADEKSWFTYYYWVDDDKAPDFARTVDIHRKPGYDPVELFLDPNIRFIKFKILYKLFKKKLGFRQLMDVIPLDSSLVKGSHGRHNDLMQSPVWISPIGEKKPNQMNSWNQLGAIEAVKIHDKIMELMED